MSILDNEGHDPLGLGNAPRPTDELRAARAEIERLQAALEPFAIIGLDVLKNHPGWANNVFSGEWCGYRLTYVQFEAAAAVTMAAHIVTGMTGNALSKEMQLHLLGDTAFVDGTFGPLGTLTGDIYCMLEEARHAKDDHAAEILLYVHERICRARHEISGDKIRSLPPRPTLTRTQSE